MTQTKRVGKLPKQLIKLICEEERWNWLSTDTDTPRMIHKMSLSEMIKEGEVSEQDRSLITTLIFNKNEQYDLYEEF